MQFSKGTIRFANQHRLRVQQAGLLRAAAYRAKSAWETHLTEPGHQETAQEARRAFERDAEVLGFTVRWDALWPTLRKPGSDRAISLPSD